MSGKNARTVKKLQERRYPFNLIDSISESFFESEESFPEDLEGSVEYVISSLSPVEQAVIKLRFGAFNNNPVTLDVISKELCLTRERIRQIEAKALRKLRHPSRCNKIRFGITGYYERLIQCKIEKKIEAAIAEKIKNITSEEIEKRRELILDEYVDFNALSVRACNCLYRKNVSTYRDIVELGIEGIQNIRNSGKKTIMEIVSHCDMKGIVLK